MIHEPRGAGSGQSTHPLSPSEKIAHGGNRTRGSLPLAPWPEERQPTELPPPPPLPIPAIPYLLFYKAELYHPPVPASASVPISSTLDPHSMSNSITSSTSSTASETL